MLYKELLDVSVNFRTKSGQFSYSNILPELFRTTKKPLGIIKETEQRYEIIGIFNDALFQAIDFY